MQYSGVTAEGINKSMTDIKYTFYSLILIV